MLAIDLYEFQLLYLIRALVFYILQKIYHAHSRLLVISDCKKIRSFLLIISKGETVILSKHAYTVKIISIALLEQLRESAYIRVQYQWHVR